MTLEQDWIRVKEAFLKLRNDSWAPKMFLFARIEHMRKANNKGIDFAIRRLKASDEYRGRIKLYGGPSGSYPRYPLRCYTPLVKMEQVFSLIGIPELNIRKNGGTKVK